MLPSLFRRSVVLIIAVAASVTWAAAQNREVTSADVQRLQAAIEDASRDVAAMRGRDGALASDLQSELDNAREDVTYLKVKLRRNEPISDREFGDLQARIDNIRSRARGDVAGGSSNPSAPRSTDRVDEPRGSTSRGATNEIPVDTEFDVRLQTPLNSGTAQVEDRVEATTALGIERGDDLLVPAGSLVTGVVRSVNKATRTNRKGSLTVSFDRIRVHGRSYPIRATVTQALESEGIAGEKGKIGAGAGVGAIIGGILGGFKGAVAGILIGGGGTIAATEGKDVDLPPGTVLRVRLDSPLTIDR
jgi:hypothetical protein